MLISSVRESHEYLCAVEIDGFFIVSILAWPAISFPM